jgi:hypothetical protein
LTPNGGGEVLNVNAGSVEAVADPTTGTVMAKGSGKGVGQRIKEGVESAVTNLCKGLLAIICGGAGSKAAEEAKKAVDKAKPSDFGLKEIIKDASGMGLKEAGEYFGWATRAVTKKAGDFTKADLIAKGFTRDVLEKMANAYEQIAQLVSKTGNVNQSAPGRAEQLREIIREVYGD